MKLLESYTKKGESPVVFFMISYQISKQKYENFFEYRGTIL